MLLKDQDFSTSDLYNEIQKGNFPSWTWKVQIMPEKDAANYRFDINDVTKIWSQADYPLITLGKMTLNRNPENYHSETEQSAFSPSHLVPGIEPSMDKMLQGRLFSYPDTHRHRLGKNYDQLPINCPYRAKVASNNRDGAAAYITKYASLEHYEPNSNPYAPKEDPSKAWSKFAVTGQAGRYNYTHPNTPYEQPRTLYNKVLTAAQRESLVQNLGGALSGARKDIQEGFLAHCYKTDPDYGTRLSKVCGTPINKAKL